MTMMSNLIVAALVGLSSTAAVPTLDERLAHVEAKVFGLQTCMKASYCLAEKGSKDDAVAVFRAVAQSCAEEYCECICAPKKDECEQKCSPPSPPK